jgi:hypothetical protein
MAHLRSMRPARYEKVGMSGDPPIEVSKKTDQPL